MSPAFLETIRRSGCILSSGICATPSGLTCSEDPKYSQIYIHIYMYVYIYIHIYICKENYIVSLLAEERCFFHQEDTKVQLQLTVSSMHKLTLMM